MGAPLSLIVPEFPFRHDISDEVLNLDVNLPQDHWIACDPTNGTVSQGDIFRFGPG